LYYRPSPSYILPLPEGGGGLKRYLLKKKERIYSEHLPPFGKGEPPLSPPSSRGEIEGGWEKYDTTYPPPPIFSPA